MVTLLLLCGCTATKVLTGSFAQIDTQKANSIKPGETRTDVERIMGVPEKKRDREYVYLFMDIRAGFDQPYIQEAHYYFDESSVVTKSTYVNMIKGAKTADPTAMIERLSSLVVGETTLDAAKERVSPTACSDHYENGSLVYRQLIYSTSRPTQKALVDLSFVTATVHDGANASYSLLFTPEGVLRLP